MRASIVLLLFYTFTWYACSDEGDSTESDTTDTGSGGDSDTDIDGDSDSDTDAVKAACKSEERVGAFAIYLAENYTTISGSVSTGVKPIGVPVLLAEEGSCTLLGPSNLFCDPACGATQTCGFDETCIEAPLKKSAGTVTLTGMNIPVTIDPNGITLDYSLKIDDPYPAFSEGAKLTLSAEGGDFEPFTLTGYGPSLINPVSPTVTVNRDAPVIVEWVPDDNDNTAIQMNLTLNVHGATSGWIICDAPDTGSFEIPAALVTDLIDLGLSGFPKIELIRRSIDSTSIAEGCVELSAYSLFKLEVEVPGLTSCNDASDCEPGQYCNNELVCEDQ